MIRQERDRAELLLTEVNHRVANSLGLVGALVRMQASVTKDKAAVDALQETQMRINAIGSVHRRLYTSARVGQVDFTDYLSSLLSELESSMHDERRPHRVTLDAVALTLTTDKVITVGLIISELVTNSFKYAYEEGDGGEIRVRVIRPEGTRIRITVEDDGRGFADGDPVKGTGLGTKIMSAMASSLDSRIEYDPAYAQGSRAVFEFAVE